MDSRVEIREVCPSIAEQWLKKNHPQNRNFRKAKAREYARIMRKGLWTLSPQAIAFDTDDHLFNGQHRLTAVIWSQVTIRSIIAWDMPKAAFLVTDNELRRSTNDQLRLAGREYPSGVGATVRKIMLGIRIGGVGISNVEIDRFLEKYGRSVVLAHKFLPHGKGHEFGVSSLRAVVARAHAGRYTDETTLQKFCKVVETGLMTRGEDAAVLIRNKVLESKKSREDGAKARGRLYQYSQIALKSYLDSQRITKLEPVNEELFPLPGESKWLIIGDD